MTEFELDGKAYRIQKLPALTQFQLHRRIIVLLPPLAPVLARFLEEKKKDGNPLNYLEAMAKLLQPFADSLCNMKDEDAAFVFSTCLSCMQRKDDTGHWAAIWAVKGNVFMFQDLEDPAKHIPMIVRVIRDTLGPFIQGFLTAQGEAEQPIA